MELVAPDLSAKLRTADEVRRRKAALAACRFALDRNSLNDPILDGAFRELEGRRQPTALTRMTLEKLVQSLDEEYFELEEATKAGRAPAEQYLEAFRKARTANALYCALSFDSLGAATESIYEANAATEDLSGLRAAVLSVLGE